MKTVARCSIYEDRPEACRVYPTAYHYTPKDCTFFFDGSGLRGGDCACETGSCCAEPRENGEPGGPPLAEELGGEPCKHLEWVDVEEEEPKEKIGSMLYTSDLLRIIE